MRLRPSPSKHYRRKKSRQRQGIHCRFPTLAGCESPRRDAASATLREVGMESAETRAVRGPGWRESLRGRVRRRLGRRLPPEEAAAFAEENLEREIPRALVFPPLMLALHLTHIFVHWVAESARPAISRTAPWRLEWTSSYWAARRLSPDTASASLRFAAFRRAPARGSTASVQSSARWRWFTSIATRASARAACRTWPPSSVPAWR